MITHATIARYLTHNHKFRKFTREDLDFMRHIEGAIQTGVRLKSTEANITVAATSKLVVERGCRLLGMLGYKTETRQIGGQPYLIIRWEEGEDNVGQPIRLGDDNLGAEGAAKTEGEGTGDPTPPSAA